MKTVKSIKMVLTVAIGLGMAMTVTGGSAIAGDPKIAGPVMAPLPSKTIPNIKLQKKKTPSIKQVEKTGVAKPALRPPVGGVNRKLLSPVRPGTTQSIKQGSGLSKPARDAISRKTVTPGQIRGPQVPVRKAYMVSGYLSVYAVPFDRWCAGSSTSTTGRAWATYNFPNDGGENNISGKLNVVTASGVRSKNVTLRFGTQNVSSNNITFTRAEICSGRCVDVYISAVRPGDASRVERRSRARSCVRE